MFGVRRRVGRGRIVRPRNNRPTTEFGRRRLLAQGYFRGTPALRQAVDEGRWKWTLDEMQAVGDDPQGLSEGERRLLRELERLLQAMQHVMTRCDSSRLQSRGFYAQANLLLASLRGPDSVKPNGQDGRRAIRADPRNVRRCIASTRMSMVLSL
jgi:hypothetical protein